MRSIADIHHEMLPLEAFSPTHRGPFSKSMKLYKKGGSAPDPNPGMIATAEATRELAASNERIAADSLSFYRQQYEEMKPLFEQITKSDLATAEANRARADEYAAYEKNTFRPLEQSIVKDATEYSTEANRERMASSAASDISQGYSTARGESARQLSRFGINPNSNRFASLNNQLTMAEAADRAGAMTKARTDAENLGFARRMDAASLGRNLASNASTAYGVSLNANQAAGGAATTPIGVMGQGYNTAITANNAAANAYGTAGNIYGQEFNARMQGYNAQQQASGAFWGGVGSAVGTGIGIWGAKKFADGGALEKKGAIKGPGGPVDDKIPALLSDGEYVVPADTVHAIGKHTLDKIVKETHTPAAVQRKRKALKGNK